MATRVGRSVVFLLVVLLLPLLLASSVAAQTSTTSLLVKLVAGLTPDQETNVIARNGGVAISSIPALHLYVVAVPASDVDAVAARYQADPQVRYVEANKTRVSESIPSDPLYSNQWYLPRTGWDQVFGSMTPAGMAKVALLDTGVDATHPELADKVVPGISLLDGSDGWTDPSGHGTWLAGIIAARTDTTPMEGIAAVAYQGVHIMPVTVLNSNGEGMDSDVVAGVIWAADHGADVILMAFSAPDFSQSLQDAIDYAWSKGVVVVAAVGNNAVGTPTFPAGDRGVMGVAATDQNDALASFSNSGQAVFVAAPGVEIQTIDINGNYIVVSGTSTSAAYVAGLAALMKAVDPTLTNGVIVGRIARNADPAGTQEETGNGRINMPRALADTSTEFIQPAGAAPVGNGGPFVGPYRAAATGTATSLTSSRNPSAVGLAVTFTATVTCTGSGSPACSTGTPVIVGTVVFGENGNANCGGGGFIQLQGSTSPDINGRVTFTTSSLSVGSHTIRACYSGTGGGSGTGDSSASLTQTINPLPTTTSISPTSKVVGQPAFTLTVNGSAFVNTGGGSVVRFNGGNRTTAFVSSTQLTASIPATDLTAAGTFSITVANPDGGTSNAQTFTVNKADTTTTITSDTPDPSVVGQGYTVSWSVTVDSPGSGTPTGTVTVTDGTGGSCSAAVAVGSCAVTSTSPGGKTLTATYGGDSNFNGSSGTATHTVNRANSTTTITSDLPDPSAVGQAYTVGVTVAAGPPGSGTPSGSVSVTDGAGGSCTISLSSGSGTCSLTSTTAGAKTLTATYGGDTNFNGSSGTAAHQVNKGDTTTTITSDTPDPSAIGQTYTVSVSVAPVSLAVGTPSGSVSVSDGAGGSCTISLSGGAGGCSLTSTTAGAKTLTATYGGDTNFNGSSGTAAHQVNKGNTTTTITSDTPDPSVVGQAYTVSVSVAPVSPAVGTPSGSVSVSDGAGGSCTISLSGGAGGCSLTSTTAGAKTLTAMYGGDANFNGSTGSTAHQVDKADTTTTITTDLSAATRVGEAYSVSFTVTVNAPGAGTPTGTVTVTDGTDSCVGTVAAGSCSLTSTTPGFPKTITATYAGDGNFIGSTSAGVAHVVDTPPTAAADWYVMVKNTLALPNTLVVYTPGVLGDDADTDGQSITVAPTSQVSVPTPTAHGTLNYLAADGSFSYTPNPDYVGPDGFTYEAYDGTFASLTVTVNLQIVEPTATPVAENDAFNATTDVPLTVSAADGVLANDRHVVGHTLAAVADASPAHGTLALNADGSFTYTPDPGFAGVDSFTYHVHDSTASANSPLALVTIAVRPAAATPTAHNDSYTTDQGVALTIAAGAGVLSNDTPPTGVTAALVSGPVYGTVTLNPDGSFTYTPGPDFSNRDSFLYRTTSGPGAVSNLARATIRLREQTTTSVTSTANSSVWGQSVSFTASVSPATATGTIQFKLDGVNFGPAVTLVNGAATSDSTSTLSVGSHTVTATYGGDDEFVMSTGSLTQTVTKADTTTTITGDSPDPSRVGQLYSVTFTVTVNPPGAGTPTGTVTVTDGATSCSASVAAGSCSLASTTAGAKTLVATYAGDSNFNPSTSAGESHQVTKADTTTTITSDLPDPSVTGQSYIVNVTVAATPPGAGTPSGSVTVSDGTGGSCTIASLSGGTGSCAVTSTSAGSKTLTATYVGDSNFNGSSGTEPHTVNKANTTTSITNNTPDPSVTGQSYAVSVTVSAAAPGAGTPSGSVTVSDGAGGSCTLTLSGAAGTCTLTSTSAGAKTLTATYAGDSNFYGSVSAGAPHTVNKAGTTTTITNASPEPSMLAQPYTAYFSVTVNSPGAGTLTGTVTVSDGTGNSCSATLAAGNCTLPSTTAGPKTLTASYSGDSNFTVSSGTRVHNIVYTFIGFLQPVDNPPVINIGNPGRTYPVKWQLKDANGNYISDLASFVSLQYTVVTCGAFDLGLSSPLDTTATGGTVLRYDASANQFIYNWQTPNASNACYVLKLTLRDGMTHTADFQMKK